MVGHIPREPACPYNPFSKKAYAYEVSDTQSTTHTTQLSNVTLMYDFLLTFIRKIFSLSYIINTRIQLTGTRYDILVNIIEQ